MKYLVHSFIDWVFPRTCVICRRKDHDLCPYCIQTFPLSQSIAPDTYSLFTYRNTKVRTALHALKYKNKQEIGIYLGKMLYEHFLETLSDLYINENLRDVLVVPIPLSQKKLRIRGFNQCDRIAEGFLKDATYDYNPHALIKKDTVAQAKIKGKNARVNNVHTIFTAHHTVAGRNILLIDDILTTGATIHDAKRALKEQGAKRIIVLTLAH